MRTRPVSVEFLYKADVEYLLKNKKYLSEGIYVDREYCEKTEESRQILRPFLQAARKLPKYHKKCKLERDTLVLNGVSYNKDSLHRLPSELSGFKISSKQSDSVFGYFGNINPFSNFYPSMFMHNGNIFHCSEQYIQYTKAKHFKEDDLANRILLADSAYGCKKITWEIQNYDHAQWNSVAKELCDSGIVAKFQQNASLQKLLLETGEKTIVECCYDQTWGTGVPLRDERCLDQRLWRSQGIMGGILENIRQNLRTVQNLNASTTMVNTTPEPTTAGAMLEGAAME